MDSAAQKPAALAGPDPEELPSDLGRHGALEHAGFPTLVSDYRARRDAWYAQGQELARMRAELIAAASRQARSIVSTAQDDVRRQLLKAHHDLLALSEEVKATVDVDGDVPRSGSGAEPADDLQELHDVLRSAQQDVHDVLGDARTELDTLAVHGDALRGSTRQAQGHSVATPEHDDRTGGAAAMFRSEATLPRVSRNLGKYVMAIAVPAGAITLAAGGWLWWQQRPAADAPQAAEVVAAGAEIPAPPPPPAPQTPSETDPVYAPAPAGLAVVVEARRSVWIRVEADERVVATRVFQPGETHLVTGARDVSVRAGDAGAVLVGVNGATPTPLGADGVALSRRFTFGEPQARTTAPAPAAATRPAAPLPPPDVSPTTALTLR